MVFNVNRNDLQGENTNPEKVLPRDNMNGYKVCTWQTHYMIGCPNVMLS